MSTITGGRLKTGSTPGSAPWTTTEASELYDVPRWGQGYFSITDQGHLQVHPNKDTSRGVDLKRLIDRLQLRGLSRPDPAPLHRHPEAPPRRDPRRLPERRSRSTSTRASIAASIPIKVNQQRQVVEEVLNFGSRVPASASRPAASRSCWPWRRSPTNDTPIICNGFKDAEFIEMAMLAQKMGRQIIPVVEKFTELELILEYAEKVGVRPNIGMRVKLAARGSGRWQSSGGYRSKFGLTVTEILRGLEELKKRGMEDCLKLLHFHLGSQITNIRIIKDALNEAARVYCELVKHGAGLEYHRRRRRPGRGLRRLADELRVVHELHAAGVRQRRRLPHPDGVRRGGRQAPDHRLRERPRRLGVPQHADLRRAGHERLRRGEDSGRRCARTSSSRWSTCSRPTTR